MKNRNFFNWLKTWLKGARLGAIVACILVTTLMYTIGELGKAPIGWIIFMTILSTGGIIGIIIEGVFDYKFYKATESYARVKVNELLRGIPVLASKEALYLTTFVIKKGRHYSNHLPKLYLDKKKEFIVRFLIDETGIYDLGNTNQLDINKEWGISFGYHMKDSIRIGTRWDLKEKKIIAYWYIHNNYEVTEGAMAMYNINELAEITVLLKDNDTVEFRTKDSMSVVPFKYPDIEIGYYLFPHFGGDEVAPHDMYHKLGWE